jgi:hypothetical protein
MDLYVLNPTTQSHNFNWRVPEGERIFTRTIDAGSQMQVLNGVSEDVFNYVVDHHKRYGMVSVSEAKSAKRSGNKIALVYSEKPMPADIYEMVDEINEDIVSRQIQLEKERSAIAVMKSVEQNPDLNEGVKAVEVEITEMTPKETARKSKPLVKQKFSSKD